MPVLALSPDAFLLISYIPKGITWAEAKNIHSNNNNNNNIMYNNINVNDANDLHVRMTLQYCHNKDIIYKPELCLLL